jgi:hypothetical protein
MRRGHFSWVTFADTPPTGDAATRTGNIGPRPSSVKIAVGRGKMVSAILAAGVLFGLGVVVRNLFSNRASPTQSAAERAWLNSLTDANKEFETWVP